ncbi:hypothetical protein MAPG_04889 [Magnaporthiopsis poae ATCC 64411]|uniref:Uncharacterized protein n=1 Tax=Magnaporthiopsis poae (strain ATCC 64411 / 73-15) TaxID=644358 RepID=A0A0C4DXY2_MAGP6|nr:hypothetical protein MAPG_04889 [Magnaporthiopsis poae ATCC 64411]
MSSAVAPSLQGHVVAWVTISGSTLNMRCSHMEHVLPGLVSGNGPQGADSFAVPVFNIGQVMQGLTSPSGAPNPAPAYQPLALITVYGFPIGALGATTFIVTCDTLRRTLAELGARRGLLTYQPGY